MKRIILLLFICPFIATAQDTSTNGISPVKFSVFIDAYYNYDFNRPADNNRPSFIYNHNRHNEFNVNLAFIKVDYTKENIRASFAIAAGTYMNANYANEPGVLKNIYQAYIGCKISRTKNLWFDMGVLPSHIGFESAVSKDCWTVTRSILAENTPFYEGGARFIYTTDNNKWLVAALVLNGWQRITRMPGNSMISLGAQIQYKPNARILLNYSNFSGTDKPDSVRKLRYYHNLYGIFQLTKITGITVGFDFAQEQKAIQKSGYNMLYAPVIIIRVSPVSQWAIAMRTEYYTDTAGILISKITPDGFKTLGFSANVDYMPSPDISFRLEAKAFRSRDNIFKKSNQPVNNNSAVIFSTSIAF